MYGDNHYSLVVLPSRQTAHAGNLEENALEDGIVYEEFLAGIFSLGKVSTRKDALEIIRMVNDVKLEQASQAKKIEGIEKMLVEVHGMLSNR